MQRHPFPFPFGFDLYLFLLRLSHDKQPFTKQAIPSIQQKQLGNTDRQTILIQTKAVPAPVSSLSKKAVHPAYATTDTKNRQDRLHDPIVSPQ